MAPLPRAELRAHAHNERHRIHSELHLVVDAVQHGVEPLDVTEPGPEWKPVHHHDAEVAIEKVTVMHSSIGRQKNGSGAKRFVEIVRWLGRLSDRLCKRLVRT